MKREINKALVTESESVFFLWKHFRSTDLGFHTPQFTFNSQNLYEKYITFSRLNVLFAFNLLLTVD